MLNNFVKKIKKIWLIPTLRDRIFYTLVMFLVVRIGVNIPIPGVDLIRLKAMSRGSFSDFVNLVSGGAFSRASIFTLSIFPYIQASILIYVLTLSFPKLEEMQKEGGKEKAKLTQWTRYLAVLASIIYSLITLQFLVSQGLVEEPTLWFYLQSIMILTASVTFLTWVGDRITTNGIGNGISLIIFVGIVARIPASLIRFINLSSNINTFLLEIAIMASIAFSLIFLIVAFQTSVRKIPVLYASGKGSNIATKSYLPMRINNSGVMPIIFAGIVANAPASLTSFMPEGWAIKSFVLTWLSPNTLPYIILYFLCVLFFTFFYTSVVFDPFKIAENLKKSGASIPGTRPGKETEQYLESVITRITFGSALFLSMIAILPFIITALVGSAYSVGGTGIIISVSVAIETLQQINGALSMEEYKSFI